ncbi:DNA-methyltransferase [Priestia megaterium]|uniref:DNA-methyltransferase n=1 Tax=Priestia megaterium TaxID=1404 RepID=UPI000CA0EC89|nr:site-specific DNA-methyltransferase [Priestia megaterium]AUO14782.1 site-specific DNA-methyltransferase [Priestia megaterium]
MELNKIYQGDCLELMKEIPDKSVDLVIIDPPYQINQGKSGGAFGRDKRDFHNQIESLTNGIPNEVLRELVRVMKKINIYIWCSKDQLRQFINFFEDLGAKTDLLAWHKTNPVPTCNNKYLSDTEYLLFFREKGVKVHGTYKTKKKYYVTPTNKEDKKLYTHPTIKPLDITENLIINSSEEKNVILDCFIGSGTTAVAALNTGRFFIGMEKEQEYVDIANERINSLKGE